MSLLNFGHLFRHWFEFPTQLIDSQNMYPKHKSYHGVLDRRSQKGCCPRVTRINSCQIIAKNSPFSRDSIIKLTITSNTTSCLSHSARKTNTHVIYKLSQFLYLYRIEQIYRVENDLALSKFICKMMFFIIKTKLQYLFC